MNHGEWLRQADYDMDTAEFMLRGGRNFYAVFMCHLSLEKAAKGLYQARLGETPPRTHSLVHLLKLVGLRPPGPLDAFVVSVSEASIATRYPETLDAASSLYPPPRAREILDKGKEVLAWIRSQL